MIAAAVLVAAAAVAGLPGPVAAARLTHLAGGGSGGCDGAGSPGRAGGGRGARGGAFPRGLRLPAWSAVTRRPDPGVVSTVARAADLVAACLEAGLPVAAALEATATALTTGATPGHEVVAGALGAAAGRLRLGATPAAAWRDGDPAVRPVAAVLSADGGMRAADGLDHAAARLRASAAAAAVARAERAGVMVAGPLGLCFLPAFVCLGVVPVVVGLAGRVLPAVQG